jgi:hypothetical protein
MILPVDIIQLLTDEEIETLIRFYGTELYKPYLAKVKRKYAKMLEILDDDE